MVRFGTVIFWCTIYAIYVSKIHETIFTYSGYNYVTILITRSIVAILYTFEFNNCLLRLILRSYQEFHLLYDQDTRNEKILNGSI